MLFQAFTSPSLQLKNRVVMAPLTRSRAVEKNTPNALMAEYYGQRAGAGLIITEGTSPSPNGLGYPRIPGLFNAEQVAGWRRVTDAVHAQGAKIFVQLMHTGRVAHLANLPAGAKVARAGGERVGRRDVHRRPGPAAAQHAAGDERGTTSQQADRRIRAGGPAGRRGRLRRRGAARRQRLPARAVPQRQCQHARRRLRRLGRTTQPLRARGGARHGGGDRRRAASASALSPYGVFNGTGAFDGVEEQYLALARELGALKLAYLHLVDHSSMGAPAVPAAFKAQAALGLWRQLHRLGRLGPPQRRTGAEGRPRRPGGLRPRLAGQPGPDRAHAGRARAERPGPATFYTPGAKGYTDYPRAEAVAAA